MNRAGIRGGTVEVDRLHVLMIKARTVAYFLFIF